MDCWERLAVTTLKDVSEIETIIPKHWTSKEGAMVAVATEEETHSDINERLVVACHVTMGDCSQGRV